MNGVVVQPDEEMEATIAEAGVQIAILAVPAGSAQAVTDRLVAAGVKAILNYAPISLSVPPDVQVQYSDPVVQLQRMTYYLRPEQTAGSSKTR
jgi:redox-sensing transcriptional repressor